MLYIKRNNNPLCNWFIIVQVNNRKELTNTLLTLEYKQECGKRLESLSTISISTHPFFALAASGQDL